MPAARLIVCEKTGRWAVAFHRALGAERHTITETRSLPQCGRELAAAPASLVAIEISADNLEAGVEMIARWSQRHPLSRLVVLLDASLSAAEAVLREAGAIRVARSTREVPAVVGLLRRHLAQVPRDELPLEDSIRARLPWERWARETV